MIIYITKGLCGGRTLDAEETEVGIVFRSKVCVDPTGNAADGRSMAQGFTKIAIEDGVIGLESTTAASEVRKSKNKLWSTEENPA